MLKAFTPSAVLILTYISGISTTSYTEIILVFFICIGVALTSYGELLFHPLGFTYVLLGVFCESCRLVSVSILMKDNKLDPLSSLYYISPLCFCVIGIACSYFEFSRLPWDMIYTYDFMLLFLANGLIAFLLNVSVVFVIAITSALTYVLIGVLKVYFTTIMFFLYTGIYNCLLIII